MAGGVTQVVEHLPSKHEAEFNSQYCQRNKILFFKLNALLNTYLNPDMQTLIVKNQL
jgi:hypothetical protein